MKTKEELNALKEKIQSVSKELRALSEEELEQVTGGAADISEILIESFENITNIMPENITIAPGQILIQK